MKERLAVTLRYLTSGDSQQSLGWIHRIGKATISKIIKETVNAIWEVLKEVYLKPPQEIADRKAISKEFKNLWNFLYCIGAMTGNMLSSNAINYLGPSTLITKVFLVRYCS